MTREESALSTLLELVELPGQEDPTTSSREDSTKVTREESALSTLLELVESPGQEDPTTSSREDSTKVTREESALSTLHELVESPGQEDPTTSSQEDSTRLSQEDSTRATRKESVLFLREEKAQVNLAQEGDTKKGVWYLDSGATNHMTGDRAAFAELDPSIVGTVKFGDGSRVNICGQGTVLFICKTGEHRAITGVYYIPRLNTQILSLGQFDENGCQILIKDGILRLRDRERKLLVKVERESNRLYKLTVRVAQPVCLAAHAGSDSAWTWHSRFGHLNFDSLRRLAKDGMVRGLPLVEHVNQICDACLAGKQRRVPFSKQARFRAKKRLELVHGDLCGPITPATAGGKRYFLLLVDDLTRYIWLALLSTKDEAAAAIIRLQTGAESESSCKLRTLRTDRGGEFTSASFTAYCAELGVERHLTAPYSPQQNGVVERRNQTIVGMARSLLKAKKVPGEFWVRQ